ncbi:14864_t:CDS:2 [Gigaspora rosea]|nr:14864_t:CDS:2 [Gigaspora rosea]
MTTKAKIGPETMPSIKPELDEFIEEAVNVTNNALSPIVPMLGVVNSLINEKFTIYENAQFNKRMSRSIINRILSVETTKKFLKSQTKYSENFQDLQHQESFVKFHATLRKIKMFVEKVTQLRAFYTFLCATNIKKEFIELTKEYEACMNDLNFTMIIVFNEQRRIDNDILTDTLAKMIKDTKTSLYQEICHIKNNLEKNKDSIQQIDPILLKEPSLSRRLERRAPYNQKCEIFSFGMIIWELAYQKIPYSNMKYNDIVVHVTKGNREICDNFLDPENKVIHESFLDIIQLGEFLR